jgi:hypothetical protein
MRPFTDTHGRAGDSKAPGPTSSTTRRGSLSRSGSTQLSTPTSSTAVVPEPSALLLRVPRRHVRGLAQDSTNGASAWRVARTPQSRIHGDPRSRLARGPRGFAAESSHALAEFRASNLGRAHRVAETKSERLLDRDSGSLVVGVLLWAVMFHLAVRVSPGPGPRVRWRRVPVDEPP